MIEGTASTASINNGICFAKNGSFKINDVRVNLAKGNSLQAVAHRINMVSGRTGVTAKVSSGGGLTLTSKNNKPIHIQDKYGVLFAIKGKDNTSCSQIPKLVDSINKEYLPKNIAKIDGNVIYLQNNEQEHYTEDFLSCVSQATLVNHSQGSADDDTASFYSCTSIDLVV